MGISIQKAYFAALVVATIFYGIFISLYVATVYVLLIVRRATSSRNLSALIVVSVMFAVATMHIAISYIRTVNALVDRSDRPGGAFAYLNNTTEATYIFQDTLYGLQTLLGDAFIIYRFYVVYGKDKRLLFPWGLVFLGSVVCALGTLISESLASPDTPVFAHKAWISSFMALTLFTNFTCTALIAFRLWSVEREVSGLKSDRYLTRVAIVIVESGGTYSISLITLLVTFILADWSQYIPLFAIIQIIGITFSLIIVRIGLDIVGEKPAIIASFKATGGTSYTHRDIDFDASFGTIHISRITEVCHYDRETKFEEDESREDLSRKASGTAYDESRSSLDISKGARTVED